MGVLARRYLEMHPASANEGEEPLAFMKDRKSTVPGTDEPNYQSSFNDAGPSSGAQVENNPHEIISSTMKLCKRMLKNLMKEDTSKTFCSPVQEGDGTPHYFAVISDPMDLGTIMKKLKNRNIDSKEEFHRLVCLVFENAMKFWRPKNIGYDLAHQFLKNFKNQFELNFGKSAILSLLETDYQMAVTKHAQVVAIEQSSVEVETGRLFDSYRWSQGKFKKRSDSGQGELISCTDEDAKKKMSQDISNKVRNMEKDLEKNAKQTGKRPYSHVFPRESPPLVLPSPTFDAESNRDLLASKKRRLPDQEASVQSFSSASHPMERSSVPQVPANPAPTLLNSSAHSNTVCLIPLDSRMGGNSDSFSSSTNIPVNEMVGKNDEGCVTPDTCDLPSEFGYSDPFMDSFDLFYREHELSKKRNDKVGEDFFHYIMEYFSLTPKEQINIAKARQFMLQFKRANDGLTKFTDKIAIDFYNNNLSNIVREMKAELPLIAIDNDGAIAEKTEQDGL